MRALPPEVRSVAHFSDCQQYRYALVRSWDAGKSYCIWIMLNPSTATEQEDDPTVAKCRRYATRWGFGGIVILNLFAWRSTDPAFLKTAADPVGPENDARLRRYVTEEYQNGIVICAWGRDGLLLSRASRVSEELRHHRNLHCLKINQSDGTPAHPLYLKETLDPVLYKSKLGIANV